MIDAHYLEYGGFGLVAVFLLFLVYKVVTAKKGSGGSGSGSGGGIKRDK